MKEKDHTFPHYVFYINVCTAVLAGKTNIAIDPDILPHLQVDRGAIRFVLSGANIMCRGLTSPGARMDVDLPAKSIVVSLTSQEGGE